MAKAKGWYRNNGLTKEERDESNKKAQALEREGMFRLKELFETSPEAQSLREIEGFSVVFNDKYGSSLSLSVTGFKDVISVVFRYPRGGWLDGGRQCIGLGVSGHTFILERSFGRHYGYDFESNVVPPATFKKIVNGVGEHLREILLVKSREGARQRMDKVTIEECQKALEKAGYEVSSGGILLTVEFKKEFREKFSQERQPKSVFFKGRGNGYMRLGRNEHENFCGRIFDVKPETIVQTMNAIENFFDIMKMLDAVR
jgi:hypothetical protein